MRIQLLIATLINCRCYAIGSVIDVDDTRGKELVTLRHATESTAALGEPTPQTTIAEATEKVQEAKADAKAQTKKK